MEDQQVNDAGSRYLAELAELIVSELQLEITAPEIEADAPLFGDGLGLDSIDALELAVAISKRYGVELRSDDARNHQIFASLRHLAAYVARHAAAPSGSVADGAG